MAAVLQMTRPVSETDSLKREIELLKRELQLAVSECCNGYFENGHFDRVAKQFGIDDPRE